MFTGLACWQGVGEARGGPGCWGARRGGLPAGMGMHMGCVRAEGSAGVCPGGRWAGLGSQGWRDRIHVPALMLIGAVT